MQKAESLDRGNNHPNQQLTIITSHSGLLVQGIIIENQESESVMLRWLHLLWLASSRFHVAPDAWGIYFRWCCSWHSYTTWKEKKNCHAVSHWLQRAFWTIGSNPADISLSLTLLCPSTVLYTSISSFWCILFICLLETVAILYHVFLSGNMYADVFMVKCMSTYPGDFFFSYGCITGGGPCWKNYVLQRSMRWI